MPLLAILGLTPLSAIVLVLLFAYTRDNPDGSTVTMAKLAKLIFSVATYPFKLLWKVLSPVLRFLFIVEDR